MVEQRKTFWLGRFTLLGCTNFGARSGWGLQVAAESYANDRGPNVFYDGILWLVAMLAAEAEENLVYDHYHPEIAGPLQELVNTLDRRLREAGVRAGKPRYWETFGDEGGDDKRGSLGLLGQSR